MTDASQTEKRLAAIGPLPPREGPAYDYDPFKRDGATVYLARWERKTARFRTWGRSARR